MPNHTIDTIKNNILNEKFIHPADKEEIEFLLTAELNLLLSAANEIREHFCGSSGTLCTIINGKSGNCSEDCKFCAQSARHQCHSDVYGFADTRALLSGCEKGYSSRIDWFSVVTSGKRLTGEDFEKACHAFTLMNEKYPVNLCASLGLLDYNQFKRLKECGVRRIHSNIETSREFFPNVCTTHTFDEKIDCIKAAKRAGLQICSGGIIGLGETITDRLSMAFTLDELNVDSIPINILMPIKGTPFENNAPLSQDEILRTFALFRFINPKKEIRFAAGRSAFDDNGRTAFSSGVNAAITGDMLTTTGTSIKDDIRLFTELGIRNKNNT